MQTQIELDDDLIASAMELGGFRSEKAAVDQALKDFVRIRRQLRAVDRLEGTGWHGDLDTMRQDLRHRQDGSLTAGK